MPVCSLPNPCLLPSIGLGLKNMLSNIGQLSRFLKGLTASRFSVLDDLVLIFLFTFPKESGNESFMP